MIFIEDRFLLILCYSKTIHFMKSLKTTVGPRTKIIFLLLVLLVTGCGSKNEQVAATSGKGKCCKGNSK